MLCYTKYSFVISCPRFAYYSLKVSDNMQMGRVLSLRKFGIAEFFQKNSFLIILTICFTLGVFLGVFIFDDISALENYPQKYIEEYILARTDRSFIKILFVSAVEFWAVLFLTFFLGTSLFGVITVPFLLILKGFLYGGITAFLYSTHALKGVAFNAVVFVPSVIVFIIVLLVAARESIRFSLKLSSLTLNRTLPFSLSQNFKDYSIKYLIFAMVVIFSSLIDALISVGILKYFSL